MNNARDAYRINIEGFARIVNDYLATRAAGHKVIFLVDEVGQFIGANSQLVLSLQTITEQLGTQCKGRAWVIVAGRGHRRGHRRGQQGQGPGLLQD